MLRQVPKEYNSTIAPQMYPNEAGKELFRCHVEGEEEPTGAFNYRHPSSFSTCRASREGREEREKVFSPAPHPFSHIEPQREQHSSGFTNNNDFFSMEPHCWIGIVPWKKGVSFGTR